MVWGKSLGPGLSFSIQEMLPRSSQTFLLFLSILGISLLPSSSCSCSWSRTFVFSCVSFVFRNSLKSSSSYLSPGSDAFVKSGMPVGNSPSPFFSRKENMSSCHSPLQSSVYFNPAWYLVFLKMFFSLFGASFDVFDPINLLHSQWRQFLRR